jgi:hypothetical protein
MPTPALPAISLYVAAAASFVGAFGLRSELVEQPHKPLLRGLGRGEVKPGIPKLDPDDAMANAAVLRLALNEVGTPGLDEKDCTALPRNFDVLLDGHRSRVRVGARAVCQLRRLKQISVGQPGFGKHGLGEVAAYILGRRMGEAVDISRVVVPPFRFSGDSVTLIDADLGALLPGEKLLGTYHTHPDDDQAQGLLSSRDLRFMRFGKVDFHGEIGRFSARSPRVDWLFDIVEPREGDWNVYAHDSRKLDELRKHCHSDTDEDCPLDEIRVTGSQYHLFTRFFEEKPLED